MLSKTGGVLVLQAAALISGTAARCLRTCPTNDSLLNLLRSEDDSSSFCRDTLGLPVSIVDVTVTPTVVATVTETSFVTEAITEVDTTLTVTVPAPSSLAVTTPVKRGIAYPTWLPTTYGTKYISQACSCLSFAPSVTTATATADAVTETAAATVTETITTTVHTTAVATETAPPAPRPVIRSVKIEAIRKNTGVSVGYLYSSNIGLAITSNSNTNSAALFQFPLPEGQTTGSQRNALSDIWSINTETRAITWQWIATSGAVSDIKLYYASARLYPVGNLERFMISTNGASGERFEVALKYTLVGETVY
ncbi:hypothetical protein NEMBOFW57_008100 [Staphylotrichum longicolle]|uniref:Uncharacterized protein n=1 Tax=Staphylotrichum longicolle TaxID=669026 RepID=A0AAD4EQN5_9PEZI|nr:hypothetical protein NEMBOFW57_008100 [Staphylotrichum longicolle]